MTSPHAGCGLATGDLEGDDDEDVVETNQNKPVVVVSNESASPGNWLAVPIIGRDSCRSATGAVAIAKFAGRSLTRQIRGSSSYASTSDTKRHFGCGAAIRIDELTVTWLSGRHVTLRDVGCNRANTVIEPKQHSP